MVEMIRDRQVEVEKEDRHDLFTSLLKANDRDLDLSESELISMFFSLHISNYVTNWWSLGNIYIFLVAGHEVRISHFLPYTCTNWQFG